MLDPAKLHGPIPDPIPPRMLQMASALVKGHVLTTPMPTLEDGVFMSGHGRNDTIIRTGMSGPPIHVLSVGSLAHVIGGPIKAGKSYVYVIDCARPGNLRISARKWRSDA